MLPVEQDGQPDPEPILAGYVPTQEQGLPGLVQDHQVGTTRNNSTLNGKMGKIVVQPSHEGLQVDESNLCSGGRAGNEHAGAAAAVIPQAEKRPTTPSSLSTKPRPRRNLIIVAITAMLVITVGVLGGVLGSRAADDSTNPAPNTSGTPSPTDIGPDAPILINRRSSLSVTAWRKGQGGLQIFLHSQSLDATLRFSTYDDTQSSFTYNGSYWGRSMELHMDSGVEERDRAANGTSLAATMVLWGTQFQPQIDLSYLSSSARVRTLYNTNNDAQSHAWGRFNDLEYIAAAGSYLTGYWPYFARLNADGVVTIWRHSPCSDVEYSETENWTQLNLSTVTVMAESKLALVPLGPNMTSLAWWGNYGLFYQDTDGKLALTQPYKNDAFSSNTLVDSWPTNEVFHSIPLGAGGSFAAFTTARPDSSQGLVNTYVLYQEASSRISMVYLDNTSQWVTTQPVALSIADNGTNIACLTMPMTQKDANGNDLDLEQASVHVNRCYFQRAGRVIEVALSGTDWTELGTIPID